jgi:hypothetical protein
VGERCRHLHIADVMLRLGDKTKEFALKNEAAKRGNAFILRNPLKPFLHFKKTR